VKETRPLREVGDDLRTWFAAQPKSQSEVARAANVDPSTVSRLVAGREPTYVTEQLRRLCKMTGIKLHRERAEDPMERISGALHNLWDGTTPQGEAIEAFLTATRKLIDAS